MGAGGLAPSPLTLATGLKLQFVNKQYFLVRELGLSKGVVSLCLEVAEISRGDRNKR